MIQSIYTTVSNADVVPCGKRHQKVKSEPIPLIKDKYLSEFRTELEKAKARANLGIGDAYSLTWENILGHIEDNDALVKYIQQQWEYTYTSEYVKTEINTVKEALDYALYYVSTFEANDEAINSALEQLKTLKQTLSDTESSLKSKIEAADDKLQENIDNLGTTLQSNIDAVVEDVEAINQEIENINQAIQDVNEALKVINVDDNIAAWIENSLKDSTTIKLNKIVTETEIPAEEGSDEEPTIETSVTYTIEVKISEEENNAIEIKDDGLYVKDYTSDITQLKSDVNEAQEDIEDLQGNLTYKASLPDDTTSPQLDGITVGDLKNKTLSEVVDTLFFPAYVRDLIQPTLVYSSVSSLVKVGDTISKPTLTYTLGDAGATIESSDKLYYGTDEITIGAYANLGTYTFRGNVKYEAGDYLVNNRGETTDSRIEAGEVNATFTVNTTYPWYAGNESEGLTVLKLVPFNTVSSELEFSLNGVAIIQLPGGNSSLSSFKVDSGLGYQDVNMEDWTMTTLTKNGITYKQWKKNSSYFSVLQHKIIFKLSL